jgi:pyruvate/2-oxoglutarate dehydrogenase complex dihydrolipoamide dehydrogenase (E3) component
MTPDTAPLIQKTFDVIVIGAGPAGEVCAGRIRERSNLTVAIVEEHLVGGECSFYGCMPSKALLRPAQALAEARRVPGAAEAVTGSLDVRAALDRRDGIINGLADDNQTPWLNERGIELIRGRGRVIAPRRIRVDDHTELTAHLAVVIATGSRAAIPKVPGLIEARPWTNREATTAEHVPDHLVVLGGGVIGVELAQAWRSLGAQVTILELAPHLLGREEPFAACLVREALEADGVEVLTDVRTTRVDRDTDDAITVALEGGRVITGSHLLVAAGRTPVTHDLGLDAVDVPAGGYLDVDDQMRVGGRAWLYAVGDVNGRSLLTHVGKYQARVTGDVIMGIDTRVHDAHVPPRVVFTEPQVAAVGHSLQSALDSGLDARAVDVATSSSAGASFYGRNTPGTSRIVIDVARDVIVGATFVGIDAMEFLHAATIAVTEEIPLARLAHSVPAFPTRAEIWLKLLEAAGA